MKADPPPIFFSKKPALLVNIDGEPIWSPIKENDLKFAVNTNWDLFLHDPTKVYYLRNEQSWLQAPDVVKGPWTAAVKLPESFKKLPGDDNWKDVKEALPGKKLSADKVPQVFVSTAPAEMILLTGEPKYQPVAGTAPALGQQHRERRVPDGAEGRRLLPGGGALVLGPRLHGAVDLRHAEAARRTSRRSPSSTRARACSRRCPAPSRRPRPCCSRRCPRPRASTRRS